MVIGPRRHPYWKAGKERGAGRDHHIEIGARHCFAAMDVRGGGGAGQATEGDLHLHGVQRRIGCEHNGRGKNKC